MLRSRAERFIVYRYRPEQWQIRMNFVELSRSSARGPAYGYFSATALRSGDSRQTGERSETRPRTTAGLAQALANTQVSSRGGSLGVLFSSGRLHNWCQTRPSAKGNGESSAGLRLQSRGWRSSLWTWTWPASRVANHEPPATRTQPIRDQLASFAEPLIFSFNRPVALQALGRFNFIASTPDSLGVMSFLSPM